MKLSAFKKLALKNIDLPVVIDGNQCTVTNDRSSLTIAVSGEGNTTVALSQFTAAQTGVKECMINGHIINGVTVAPFNVDTIYPNEWDRGNYLGEGRITVADIKKVAYAMAKNDVRYYLDGVNFENGFMVATDGHRLATTSANIIMIDGESCIVERSMVEILLLAGPSDIDIEFYKEVTIFNGFGWQLITKNIGARYPDWRRVIHKEAKLEFDLDAKKVIDDCKRIVAMQKARKEKFLSVAIDEYDGSVTDSSDGYVLVNPPYLADLLDATGNVSCYWSGQQLVAHVNSDYHVIMGMRGAKK